MPKGAYTITKEFEEELERYTGAPHAVAIDNASNALFLCLMYENIKGKTVRLPSHTYPSVPCEVIHAGGNVTFYPSDEILEGAYQLHPTKIWDSALRFTCDMYIKNSHMCLSFTGPYKHLKLDKGGTILTDDPIAYKWFKRSRFSGRRECTYFEDDLDMMGWNFYMPPEVATRGLQLMRQFYDREGKRISKADIRLPYPDLSNRMIYKTIWSQNLEGDSI